MVTISRNIADILEKVNLKIPETINIRETTPQYSGTPLEPIGASSPRVKEVLTEVEAKQILGSGSPSAPFTSSVVELQQELTTTKKEESNQSRDNSNGNGANGNGNQDQTNTIIEGLLAGLMPGTYLIDQLKDLFTQEKQTTVDVAAAPSMTFFGLPGGLMAGTTLQSAGDTGLIPDIGFKFPDLGDLPKYALIGIGALAGIWLLGKYIGRGK